MTHRATADETFHFCTASRPCNGTDYALWNSPEFSLPNHTQSVEICVKAVTEVVVVDRRNGYIRATELRRDPLLNEGKQIMLNVPEILKLVMQCYRHPSKLWQKS